MMNSISSLAHPLRDRCTSRIRGISARRARQHNRRSFSPHPKIMQSLRVIACWGIALAAYVVLPAIGSSLEQLEDFYRQTFVERATRPAEWRAPRGGEWVLPARVRAMVALLRRNGVQDFRFSAASVGAADPLLTQRLAEGAFPIRVRATARDMLVAAGEDPGANCRVVDTEQDVALDHCS
jgi:hypothetical protein